MTDKTLFKDERPDVHLLKDIYDPDDPNSGSIIPLEGSLVHMGDGIYYYVAHVHSVTHKTTLNPQKIVDVDDDTITSIVDYDNSRFHVFYDDRVEPTKLNIDSLLTLFGINNTEYVLKRVNPESMEEEIVSVYYNANGEFVGNRIPMALNQETQTKYCTNCHTLLSLTDNEKIVMEVYDHAGTLSAQVVLWTKRATILNDLAEPKIITDFQLRSVQEKDGYIQLFEKQDISALMLTPTLKYNNGEEEIVPVDDQVCFLYGVEDLIASYPGLKQTVMCKYFLRPSQQASNAVDHVKGRFVVVEKDIIVKGNEMLFSVKLSIIPIWNFAESKYVLYFYLYSTTRQHAMDVTEHVEILSVFNGQDFDREQELQYSIKLHEIFDFDGTNTHVQKTWLRLKPWNLGVERYIIKDTAEDEYAYGVESSTYRRPVIHYDETLGQYFIPTSIFENVEAFLEVTYIHAHPLFDNNVELNAPEPTHFTVRNPLTQNTVTPAPIPINEYSQAWSSMASGLPEQHVDNVMLIEFLVQVEDEYHIIWGSPVDVHRSATGYNT